MEKITTQLYEETIKEMDKLVQKKVFLSREDVLRTGLETLLQFPEEEIKKIEKARAVVNGYLTVYVGDILFAGFPLKVAIKNKEYFRVPVKGKYEGRIYTYGYILVDCESLQIGTSLSDSPKQIHINALKLTGGKESDSPLL